MVDPLDRVSVLGRSHPLKVEKVDKTSGLDGGGSLVDGGLSEKITPAEDVSKVELPRASFVAKRTDDHGLLIETRVEVDHGAKKVVLRLSKFRVDARTDLVEIVVIKLFNKDLRESVEEGLWKALSATSLLRGVLAAKHTEGRRARELATEFRDVDSGSVIETGVETFEDRLRGQVELIKKDPVAFFEGTEEDTIVPLELTSFSAFNWKIGSEEIHHVCLLRQVDADDLVARGSSESLHQ